MNNTPSKTGFRGGVWKAILLFCVLPRIYYALALHFLYSQILAKAQARE